MKKRYKVADKQNAALWRLIARLEMMLRCKGISRSELDEVRLRVFERERMEKERCHRFKVNLSPSAVSKTSHGTGSSWRRPPFGRRAKTR